MKTTKMENFTDQSKEYAIPMEIIIFYKVHTCKTNFLAEEKTFTCAEKEAMENDNYYSISDHIQCLLLDYWTSDYGNKLRREIVGIMETYENI